MNVVFSIDYANSPDSDDVLAARHIVFLENRRRAALVPPGAVLPTGNAAQIKASYLSLLVELLTAQHIANTELAKSIIGLSSRFTQAERNQIFANITARLNGGESASAIVTDTAA